MFQRRVVAGDNFGDGIGEIRRVVRRNVTFNDRRLAVGSGDDEVARLNGFAALFRGGNKNELNRFGNRNSGRPFYECPAAPVKLPQPPPRIKFM